jgi:hypothetical protein
MRFTSDELMFLTAMTKGPVPFGIFFDKRRGPKAAEAAANAKRNLIKKEILSENGITPKGFAVIKLWEDYRNADKHLVVNNMVIGLLENRRCVLIVRDENGFEIASGDSTGVMLGFLKNYPSLRRADKNVEVSNPSEKMNYEECRKDISNYGNNYFTIGVFPSNKRPGEERFIYWNNDCFFSYNPNTHIRISIEPSDVRRFILESLNLNKEVLANGL